MIKSGFNVASVRLLLTGRTVCENHMTEGRFFKIGWSQKIYRGAQIRSTVDLSWVTLDLETNYQSPDRPTNTTAILIRVISSVFNFHYYLQLQHCCMYLSSFLAPLLKSPYGR